jgi:hypothetical protein
VRAVVGRGAGGRYRREETPLTQSQLESAVAAVTGETVRTVHQLGFGISARRSGDLEPEDLRLVVDCPFCRHPVPSPAWARDGSLTLAECVICDVYFNATTDEIYAASARVRIHPLDFV